MQVYVSKPHGSKLGGLEDRLLNRWRQCVAQTPDATLVPIEAQRHEIHGDLLTRIWDSKILAAPDHEFVISEYDFLPSRRLLNCLRAMGDAGLTLVGVPYVTREYAPTDRPSKQKGKLTPHSHEDLPLLGAWLIYVNIANSKSPPPLDWLAAAGPFNDAANLALHRGIASGFLTPKSVALLKTRDAWPWIHGTRYPKMGIHAFFSRALDLPPDSPACWPSNPDTLTAGEHFKNLRRILR